MGEVNSEGVLFVVFPVGVCEVESRLRATCHEVRRDVNLTFVSKSFKERVMALPQHDIPLKAR